MGQMTFLLPSGLPADAARELERACVAGGPPDHMPWPTDARLDGDRLIVRRDVDESGYLLVPWQINGAGRIMGSTATLTERDHPYQFQVELARGKVNQLRNQAADWRFVGLQLAPEIADAIREASHAFCKAITAPSDQAGAQAQDALGQSYLAGEELVRTYIDQIFQVRHQRQHQLDTILGCRMGVSIPQGIAADGLLQACNTLCLPFIWKEVEPTEASYAWEPYDAMLKWAENQGIPISAGPLIDFSPNQLPDWLWLWERDLHSLASFMCEYVETAVKRYRGRIRVWQLTAGSNWSSVLGLGEDELLWLTVRLAEAARQIESSLDLVVGITQPWGEYMALEDRTHSPFIFADTLVRAGLNLAALDLKWIMGVLPRGTYCRDLLEASRLLDLYALLGVPLQVTLGYPSTADADPKADPEMRVGGGFWKTGCSPDTQADWASQFGALALCKPYVRGLQWVHFTDAERHQFPHCGLIDATGKPKPALQKLAELRAMHLR